MGHARAHLADALTFDENLLIGLDASISYVDETARADEVPAYVVFTDATLSAIAEAKPRSVSELVAVPGVGQRKLDEYGAEVLALVAESG